METNIQPPGKLSFSLKEFWQYRELFYFFTWRDVRVKYKQTYLGIGWAILQPLGMMLIFTLLFSRTWKIDTGTVQYPVFVLAGLILWNMFNGAVSQAGESMIRHANIINKIYFPRLIIPCSAVLVALFDFIAGLIVFLVFCFIYKQPISLSAFVYFPAAIMITVITATGAGSFLSALNVKYRDFRYALPFLLQLLFFTSQVIYPLGSLQPAWIKQVLAINPVNAAIELFRSPLSGIAPDWNTVMIGTGSMLLILLTGLFYFRKTESYFADIA